MVEIRFDQSALAKLHMLGEEMREDVVEEVADDARNYAPVEDGDLRDSIHVEGNQIRVGTDHWAEQEFGARPHVIEPENRDALFWEGAPHPVDRVYHPGNPAQPYMRPALYKRRKV